ncbi:MAG TPA: tyrosine-type recombinase/integrase [Bryobacteraceae bacterium]
MPFSYWLADWDCALETFRTLKLDQLHWEDSTIEITQSKTATPLRLPLTNEVGDALIDYLKSGRLQTLHREIFLKVNPPFDPFTGSNLHHIVTYWRLLAGIRFRTPQKRGAHSLRHYAASRTMPHESTAAALVALSATTDAA